MSDYNFAGIDGLSDYEVTATAYVQDDGATVYVSISGYDGHMRFPLDQFDEFLTALGRGVGRTGRWVSDAPDTPAGDRAGA